MEKIVLKRKKFANHQLMMALQKLASTSFDTKTAYSVKKVIDAIQIEMKKTQTECLELLGKFASKDDKGELERTEDFKFKFATPELEKEYDVAEAAFGEFDVVIERAPLAVSTIANARFTPSEIDILENIVDFSGMETPPGLTADDLAKMQASGNVLQMK